MRRTFAVLALLAGVATSAQAQQAWQTEIGVQGGYVRIKPAGTGTADQIDVFALPGASYVLGLLSHGTVYAVIPWKDKIAIEPSFVFSQVETGGGPLTSAQVGLRANYALTPKVYAAGGAELLLLESAGQRTKQLGLQAALGYRMRLVGPLNGRLEAHFATRKGTDELTANNVYGVLFGVSTRLRGAAGPTARRAASGQAWQRVLGISGGYVQSHGVGGVQDVTGIALPGLGGSLTGLGLPVGSPPTMFVIFPVGRKTAIEPGFDFVRSQQNGTTVFSGNLSARVNYAVSGGWYAAAGGNLNYVKATGTDAATITGANVAWGYRFPLTGAWGGRVELNYTMFGKNEDLGIPPQNVVGVMFGTTMPLR